MVSVITLTYNHEKYIGKSIESVLSQSYTDWEMLIVNDNSTDATLKIAESYARKDKRIKIINHNKRWGIEKIHNSYNQALSRAKGDLIAILEGDDFWGSDKLENQWKNFKKDIVLSYGDCVTVSEEGIPFRIVWYNGSNFLQNKPIGSILHSFTNLNFYFEPITVMVKKETLVKIGGFQKDPDYPFIDLPTWLQLSLEGNFHYNRKTFGYYRKQHNSSWFSFASKTDAMGREQVKKCFLRFITKNARKIEQLKINLGVDIIGDEQDKYISIKKDNKGISELLHYYVFGNYTFVKRKTRQILKSRRASWLKMIAVLTIASFPSRKIVLRVVYLVYLIRYKLRN